METLPRLGARAMRITLAASIALHLAAVVPFVVRRGSKHPTTTATPAPMESSDPPDLWVGNSPFVGGEKLVEVDTAAAEPPGGKPAEPNAEAPPAEPKAEAPEPEPPPAPPPSKALPAPAKPKPAPKPKEDGDLPSEPRQAKAAASSGARAKPPGAAGGDDGGGVHPGTFGSEGQAGVRSVGRAFTRAIPPACQGDPAWGSIAAGTTFKAELTLFVDATGHIEKTAFTERDVPAPIAAIVKRTLPLIESNTLSIRGGAVVRGTERLKLVVTVSDAAGRATDELELAPFDGGLGKASFTQPSGKHVEVLVKVVKVEVAAE